MIEQLLSMIERIGQFIRKLNETFYFYVDIETSISWAVIILLYLLYKLIDHYFEDRKMTSDELVKLLAIYMLILTAVMTSYTDFGEILERANPEYSFFIITVTMLVLVIILAWGGATENAAAKKRWMVIALYTPIILLMLSNGEIIEQRLDSLKALLPRTNLTFINLPGEMETLEIGGEVSAEQVLRIEKMIDDMEAVNESAIVGYEDTDGLIKPYALVVLESGYLRSRELKREIKDYVAEGIEESRITQDMYPYYIEFIERYRLPKPGEGTIYQKRMEQILNEHRAVYKSAVVTERDDRVDRSVAYVALEDGYSGSRQLGRELMDHILEGIKRYNSLSRYMRPEWVSFADRQELPRTSSGAIDHRKLQKMVKNWSKVFPGAPSRNPFEKGE